MTYRLVAFVVKSIKLPFYVMFLGLENYLWRVKEGAQWLKHLAEKHEDLGTVAHFRDPNHERSRGDREAGGFP